MTQPGLPARIHTRLAGIDFPGMQVEDEGSPVALIDALERRTRQPVGEDAEISATRHRQSQRAPARDRHRKLDASAGRWSSDLVRLEGWIGDAVVVVMNREHARVVAEPRVDALIERPEGGLHDGKAGGAVADNRCADEILEQL